MKTTVTIPAALPHNLAVWRAISPVSSGSFSSLTGLKRYDELDAVMIWMFDYLAQLDQPFAGNPATFRENITALFAIYQSLPTPPQSGVDPLG